MIKKLSYYIPLAQAHTKKLAEAIILESAKIGGEIAQDATEFPEGTIIEMSAPEIRSKKNKNEIEHHPVWTAILPEDDENAIEYQPSRAEYEKFNAAYIALRKIQIAYFKSDKDQALLAQSKEMERTLDRQAGELRRRAKFGTARSPKRDATA